MPLTAGGSQQTRRYLRSHQWQAPHRSSVGRSCRELPCTLQGASGQTSRGDGKKTMKQTFGIQRPESILAVSTWFWSPSACNLHGGSSECHHRGVHRLYFAAQFPYICTEAQTHPLLRPTHSAAHSRIYA